MVVVALLSRLALVVATSRSVTMVPAVEDRKVDFKVVTSNGVCTNHIYCTRHTCTDADGGV